MKRKKIYLLLIVLFISFISVGCDDAKRAEDPTDKDTIDNDDKDVITYDEDENGSDDDMFSDTEADDDVINDTDTETPDENQDADIDETPDEDATAPATIVIGVYNVLRFFDTNCDSGSCDSGDYEEQFSTYEFEQKAMSVANSIEDIDADIVMLEEVETKECVEQLMTLLEGKYDGYFFASTGDGSVNTAMLYKGEKVRQTLHSRTISCDFDGDGSEDYSGLFARNFAEIHVAYKGRNIILFPVHYKAKSYDDPDRRRCEAKVTHDTLVEAAEKYPDSLIVTGGDMNDTPGSDPLDELSDDGKLLRVASDISDDSTYKYNGTGQAIDHIFVSKEAAGSYVAKSAKVVKDGNYYLGDSDHAALKATFKLP